MLTTEDRFKKAIQAARLNGAVVRQNMNKCCRSCLEPKDFRLTEDFTEPLAYTFGGQGHAIYWEDGNPVIRTGGKSWGGKYYTKPETEAYFNHENGGGYLIAAAMRAQGFEVDWDETDAKCVVVKFPEL